MSRWFSLVLLAAACGDAASPPMTDAGAPDRAPTADASELADAGPDAVTEAGVDAWSSPSDITGAGGFWIEVDDTSLYWVGTFGSAAAPHELWKMPKGGGTPTKLVDLTSDGGVGQVFALTQDATDLFFFETHGDQVGRPVTVNRVSKSGGVAPAVLAEFTILPLAVDLTTDGTDVFWVTDDGTIHRTPVGGGPTVTFYTGALVSLGGRQIVLDPSKHLVYTANTMGLVAIDTTTSQVTQVDKTVFVLGQMAHAPGGVVFAAGDGTLWRGVGTTAMSLGAQSHTAVQGIGTSTTSVYWFHDGVGAPALTDGALSVLSLDGGTESIVRGGLESLEDYGNCVALDDASVYFSAIVVPDAGFGVPHIFAAPAP